MLSAPDLASSIDGAHDAANNGTSWTHSSCFQANPPAVHRGATHLLALLVVFPGNPIYAALKWVCCTWFGGVFIAAAMQTASRQQCHPWVAPRQKPLQHKQARLHASCLVPGLPLLLSLHMCACGRIGGLDSHTVQASDGMCCRGATVNARPHLSC